MGWTVGFNLNAHRMPSGTLIQSQILLWSTDKRKILPGSIGLVIKHKNQRSFDALWCTFDEKGNPLTFVGTVTFTFSPIGGWTNTFEVMSLPDGVRMGSWMEYIDGGDE